MRKLSCALYKYRKKAHMNFAKNVIVVVVVFMLGVFAGSLVTAKALATRTTTTELQHSTVFQVISGITTTYSIFG